MIVISQSGIAFVVYIPRPLRVCYLCSQLLGDSTKLSAAQRGESSSVYVCSMCLCLLSGAPRSEQYTYGARFLGSTLLDEGKSHAVFSAALKRASADQEDLGIDHPDSRVSIRISIDGIRWVAAAVGPCRE